MISSEVWNCCLGIIKLSIGIDTSAAIFGIMRFNETKELRFKIVGQTHPHRSKMQPMPKSPCLTRAFCVFRDKKHHPFTIAPFLKPYGLEPATL